jgi:NADH dehydrogenase
MNTTGSKVLVVGGGFGGLYAACELGRRKIPTVLIDMRNFHLFQPLLYQVATGFLSPGDIAAPLRTIVAGYPSVDVLQCRLLDLEPDSKIAHTSIGPIEYSELVLSCGLSTSYFGHDSWGALAPGMKSIEDALEVRRRIFEKFELAESSANSRAAGDQLNFVIVGGGPTGVELAGAFAELARGTLNGEFHRIDPRTAKITLFEVVGEFWRHFIRRVQNMLLWH